MTIIIVIMVFMPVERNVYNLINLTLFTHKSFTTSLLADEILSVTSIVISLSVNIITNYKNARKH